MVPGKKQLKNWIIYLQRVGAQFFGVKNDKCENTRSFAKSVGFVQLQKLFQHVDHLQNLMLIAKAGVREAPLQAQTCLFHVSRSLIQIREQAYHFQYRLNQLSETDNMSQEDVFQPILDSMHKCQQVIVAIINVVESRGVLSLIQNDKFFMMVNTLELNAAELSSHMRGYNQICAQKDTLNALFELETLFSDRFSAKSNIPKFYSSSFEGHYEIAERESFVRGQGNEFASELMKKIELMTNPLYRQFVKETVEIYLELKKCYVVSRKSVINNTLKNISDDIESLILAVENIDECVEDALSALHSIYSGLESIRFSTNTESRCSRNLFDKSKQARTKLRQACSHCDLGLMFLNQIALKKTIYTKQK